METPLKWTIKGHIPIDSLKQEVVWVDEMKENRRMILQVLWFLGEEVVANDVHIYQGKPKRKYVRKSGDVTIGLHGVGIDGAQAKIQ